ncbi:fumarylacetoacetate hydrolase, partial [Streptomyces sp. SID10244]|nr:fumarylacetoacetate hydrolase [Streptomyces sp. SID10244]
MRIANHDGRAVLVTGDSGAEQGIDIATASDGRFGPDPAAIYDRWSEVDDWAAAFDASSAAGSPIDRARLG